MAKVVERPASQLYEADFALWAKQQAELLRTGRYQELDLDHLIEEVADLGTSERCAVSGAARRIIEHLLKLEHSPAREPRRSWEDSVTAHRTDLEEQLTPTLRRDVERELSQVYGRARRDAARDLHRDRVSRDALPDVCPYSLDQILDPEWLPMNRHGIEDGR